jgi:hypothetical protein
MNINHLAIGILIIVFMCIMFKKMKIEKNDSDSVDSNENAKKQHLLSNDNMQFMANVAVVLTLGYAVFSYSHSVYPIFEKQTQLNEALRTVEEQNVIISQLESTGKGNVTIINQTNERIVLLEEQLGHMQIEQQNMAGELFALELTAASNQRKAVYFLALSEINDIITISIYRNTFSSSSYDPLVELGKIVESKILRFDEGTIEHTAYLILQDFKIHLAEAFPHQDITHEELLTFYTYFYTAYEQYSSKIH